MIKWTKMRFESFEKCAHNSKSGFSTMGNKTNCYTHTHKKFRSIFFYKKISSSSKVNCKYSKDNSNITSAIKLHVCLYSKKSQEWFSYKNRLEIEKSIFPFFSTLWLYMMDGKVEELHLYYSRSRLMWSLWATLKLITLTEW